MLRKAWPAHVHLQPRPATECAEIQVPRAGLFGNSAERIAPEKSVPSAQKSGAPPRFGNLRPGVPLTPGRRSRRALGKSAQAGGRVRESGYTYVGGWRMTSLVSIRALLLSRNDGLVWRRLVSIASQRRLDDGRRRDRNVESGPSEMGLGVDFEFQTAKALLDTLAVSAREPTESIPLTVFSQGGILPFRVGRSQRSVSLPVFPRIESLEFGSSRRILRDFARRLADTATRHREE
jgi:hypothetical protein